MSEVLIDITVHARGQMATKLLEAAEELGLSPYAIKSTSEGFRVPTAVHAHLFPSQYGETKPVDSPDNKPDGQGVVIDPTDGGAEPGDGLPTGDELTSNPAEDFAEPVEPDQAPRARRSRAKG